MAIMPTHTPGQLGIARSVGRDVMRHQKRRCEMEMMKSEAMRWIAEHGDDDNLEEEELEAAFRAIYGRQPDAEDREKGLWSVLCADPDVTRWIDAHTRED